MVEETETLPNFFKEEGKEVAVSSEFKNLLKSLPSEKGWGPQHHYHLYNGFWYVPQLLNAVLSIQKNFRPNHSDILLATAPKSGTTWLKALVFALLNRSRYSSNDHHPLLQNNPHELVPYLEMNLFMHDPNPDLSSFAAEPKRLFSTHMPFSALPTTVSSQCKIVYLSRNPKDALISLWHFINKMKTNAISLEEAVDKFCRGFCLFGPFWDHVLEYWKASEEMPDNVLFLKYEEIKEKPDEELRKLARFLGCPFSQEEESNGKVEEISKMCSFESLRGVQVNMTGKMSISSASNKDFFRQGKVGDSINYLTEEMIHKLDRITEEKLRGSTLKLL